MRVVKIREAGGPEQLYVGELEQPKPGPGEVLVNIKATALNRADLLQRQGKYPPPEGASPILGLEIAGEVVEINGHSHRTQFQLNDKVMALLPGGGYAEYAVVPQDVCMPIPEGMSFEEAAAIPEVWLTAFQALFLLGNFSNQQTILIHAAASGVGTAAIQLARPFAQQIFGTASQPKHALCLKLGTDQMIDYSSEDFAKKIQEYTQSKGVDLIIDFIGGPYFKQNLDVLGLEGTLVMLGFMGGVKVPDVNLASILRKRISIVGSTLRNRNHSYKKELIKRFWEYAKDSFEQGIFKPIIDSVYDWEQVAEAHAYMESNQNAGKIVMRINA